MGLIGQIEHCGAGDGRDAGGKAIEPVDEVDDVGEGHKVDNGDGVGEPSNGNELGREGVGDIADDQAGGSGYACGENLSQQFLARLEVAHVVDGAREEDNDDGNGQQLVVDALQLHMRNKDGGPPKQLGACHLRCHGSHKSQRNADAAHAGNRDLVDAPLTGLVDGTQVLGDALGERGCQERRKQRNKKEKGIMLGRVHAFTSRPSPHCGACGRAGRLLQSGAVTR